LDETYAILSGRCGTGIRQVTHMYSIGLDLVVCSDTDHAVIHHEEFIKLVTIDK